jgi:hypothetical protein
VSGVTVTDLERVAFLIGEAQTAAGFASLEVANAIQTGDTSNLRAAYEQAKQARTNAEQALNRLLSLGVARPGPAVARDALPLSLLDTPATRRLLAALEAAAEAGAAVDKERRWVDEDGEPVGHGETLAGMALVIRREIFGPEGRD